MLTRIRSALPKTAEDQEYTSLFEAGDNSARSLLDQLIGDATLMWESIKDQDTRISANRQVHIAGIYANFQDCFSKALDKLTEELGRPYGHGQQRSIILPIDNIDRSTDHLQNIVKLAQLVSHPRLWLVMAGGREDVDTFLERAYWKELIRNSGGSVGIGKTESRGEDETLTMARRQAAATALKIWPCSHRIAIGPMKPNETLEFKPPGMDTIKELLKQVKVWTWFEREDPKELISISMLQWFERDLGLTQIGKYGLKLPVRSALELWQLVYWVVKDKTSFPDHEGDADQRAEQIARTMLRVAISESRISNHLSQRLQNEVIRVDINGGTLLNFKEVNLRVESLAPTDTDLVLPIQPYDTVTPVQSLIRVKRGEDSFILFKLGDGKDIEEALPELVAAWLALLYDVLKLAKRLAILNPATIQPPIMVTRHAVVIQNAETGMRHLEERELQWPAPDWMTFRAHGVFWETWKKFQENLYEGSKDSKSDDLLPRYLALGWISCILQTIDVLMASPSKTDFNDHPIPSDDATMFKYERQLLLEAAAKYGELKSYESRTHIHTQICEWFQLDLPIFFSYWYVPQVKNAISSTRFSNMMSVLDDSKVENSNDKNKNLAQLWADNKAFIAAKLDDRLNKLFVPEPGMPERDKEKLSLIHKEYWKTLRELCELHRWQESTENHPPLEH